MTTISQERSLLAAVGMRLRRREEWGARHNYSTARTVHTAQHQFVHITVTNPRSYSSDDAHARAVEAIGRARFSATGGSYNRLAMQSGRVYELQPMGRRGAHTVNDKKLSRCSTSGCPTRGGSLSAPSYNLNYNARAYAIAQNVGDKVTDAQLNNLARAMAADRLAGLVSRNASIHGHRCVAWKDCPGTPMWRLMGQLEKKINHYMRVGVGQGLPDTGEDDVSAKDVLEALASDEGQGYLANAIAKAFRDGPVVEREFGKLVERSLAADASQTAIANALARGLRDGHVVQREVKKLVDEAVHDDFHRQKELHAQTRAEVRESRGDE